MGEDGENSDKDPVFDLSGEAERLRAFGIRPKVQWGQNFLFNPRLLEFIIDQAEIVPGDHVLEVGPGSGALSRRLLARGAQVTAVEIDPNLCRLLRTELAGEQTFRLIEGDVLKDKHNLNSAVLDQCAGPDKPLKVVSNLPYHCATPFLLELFGAAPRLQSVVVTIQLEVADRFAAIPRTSHYGIASVLVQLSAKVQKVKRISRSAFWPQPNVDSAVVKFAPFYNDRPIGALYRDLQDLLSFSFSERRKKLLTRLLRQWPAFDFKGTVPADKRPEAFTPQEYLEMVQLIKG